MWSNLNDANQSQLLGCILFDARWGGCVIFLGVGGIAIFGTAQTPSVIVTDWEEGYLPLFVMSSQVKRFYWLIIVVLFIEYVLITLNVVFNVDVRHLLCVWHIANDVENMVEKLCGGKRNQQGQIFRKTRWNPFS